jgi:hypothetical protein
MNNHDSPAQLSSQEDDQQPLQEIIRVIAASRKHDREKRVIKAIASELSLSFLDCAAALAYHVMKGSEFVNTRQSTVLKDARLAAVPRKIRLVRYRLAVGEQHQITLEGIKKVLVDESGVDIKNIANVKIQDTFTLIDLPDEMPQEIFLHLKMVEINHQKLDIRRLKPRSRKNNNFRRFRSPRKQEQGHNFTNEME